MREHHVARRIAYRLADPLENDEGRGRGPTARQRKRRHGQHLDFDENNHPPLCNLYVSMLQRMGIAADKFGSGNATLTGLEMRG